MAASQVKKSQVSQASKALTPQQRDAAQRVVAKGLQTLPDNYVECRGMMHAWRVLNDFRIMDSPTQNGPRFLRRDLTCTRDCGVVRHDTFLLRFVRGEPQISEKVRAHYTYPDDYQMPGVPRGVKRQVVVYQEQFRRAMEKAAGALAGERERSD